MVIPYHIILASNSPRRKELLSGLDLDYEVKVLPDIEESYPESLPISEVPIYIAVEKAAAYQSMMTDRDLIITADTVVVLGDEVLGKPTDLDDARRMLRELSGQTHQVITGVCLMTREKKRQFAVTTNVTFKELAVVLLPSEATCNVPNVPIPKTDRLLPILKPKFEYKIS